MRKSCKNIDIKDFSTIRPWVLDCCMRHKKRHDFKQLFLNHGMNEKDYKLAILAQDYSTFDKPIDSICREAIRRIEKRELNLPPVHIRMMNDSTTGKLRPIGWESAIQQVFDYIAVHSSMPIFLRRIVCEQASSIPGRGQVYGAKLIQEWIQTDNDAARFARKHGLSYTRKCRYFVKLDIRKCYPYANRNRFLELFEKDCGNEDIIWLWTVLIRSHETDYDELQPDGSMKHIHYTGFLIGALPSQWACQYMISFLYRHVKSLTIRRRNNRIPLVSHMIMFMDDMLLTGSNRKSLKTAVEGLIKYSEYYLGWFIKPEWHIRDIDLFAIDMMGYVIHSDGHITIRGRNYVKSRRLALRFQKENNITLTSARRITSYKGFYDHSDVRKPYNEYGMQKCFNAASKVIGIYDRRKNNADRKSVLRLSTAGWH